MKQVSDKALTILAIFAIGISLTGVFVSMQKGENLLSGAATGSVNVSINETVSINLIRDTVNFTASAPSEMKSSTINTDVSQCTLANDCGFIIANNGSSIANVSLQTTEDLFDSASTSATTFRAKVNANAANTRDDYDKKAGCSGSSSTSWTDVRNSAGVKASFISCMNYSVGNNTAQVDMNITVPADEPSGRKGSTVTFTGSVA